MNQYIFTVIIDPRSKHELTESVSVIADNLEDAINGARQFVLHNFFSDKVWFATMRKQPTSKVA